MEPLSIDPAASAIGPQVVDIASRGLSAGATVSMSLTALAPAGG